MRGVKGSGPGKRVSSRGRKYPKRRKARNGLRSLDSAASGLGTGGGKKKTGRGGYTPPTITAWAHGPEGIAAARAYASAHKGATLKDPFQEVEARTGRAIPTDPEDAQVKVIVALPTKIGVKALLKSCKRNEPIFVLRAQDALAPALVRRWAREAARLGVNDIKVALADSVAEAMEAWPARRLPD